MTAYKLCLINEQKYSSYHNPGNTAAKLIKNNFNNLEIFDDIPENLEKYLIKNNFDTLIFLNVPTTRISIFEISKIQKSINIGMYFDDSAQYFNNWFRYLTQVIDFALCREPTDVHLFESYGVPSAFLPGLFVNYLDKLLNQQKISWENKKIDIIHVGRMDRPGRKSLEEVIKYKFINSEFWGDGTKNGYINTDTYIEKIFNSRIAINNSGCAKYNFVRKSDPIEWERKQFKGKLFHYFLSKCVVLTQDSPLLDKYFDIGKDLLVYKSNEDLISKIDLLIANPDLSKKISHSGYKKAKSYIDEKQNIETFLNLLERAKNKKTYKNLNQIYIDKYFSRSIAAFAGDEIVSSLSNFSIFVKTFKFLLFDFRVLKILFRKMIKKLIYG